MLAANNVHGLFPGTSALMIKEFPADIGIARLSAIKVAPPAYRMLKN
jgi:hypothetical protein